MKRVVITGIGAVTPIGNNAKEYFNSLKNGVCGIGYVTRFDATPFKTKIVAEVKNFDESALFDKILEKKIDLNVKYAVAAATEAFSDSGLELVDRNDMGVIAATGVGGINTTCEEEDKLKEGGPLKVSSHFVPKMIINMAAGHIAIRLKAHGTAKQISTACASGSDAIGEAYRAVKDGYLNIAVCAGTEAAVNPPTFAGFINCMALSQANDPNGASLPFDKRRAGFVLGEGAACMILEEHEHAIARGAKIYAEVVGYGSTCDAFHITAPEPSAAQTARAITMSLEGVDYNPAKMYMNAHGTGTPKNDVTETKAIKLAFGDGAYKLKVSSTKSMTGHMMGAAGVAEALACIMALNTGIIPPTINLNAPDPECDLDYVPNKAIEHEVDVAISTSLGFGGHNACVAFKKV
jgi:3-oxoacyl-[acyl-carrier-protein] synthase II